MYGFFILLHGSSSAESDPVATCKISHFERSEHVPWKLARTHICAVVYSHGPGVPLSGKREKRLTTGRETFFIPEKSIVYILMYVEVYTRYILAS